MTLSADEINRPAAGSDLEMTTATTATTVTAVTAVTRASLALIMSPALETTVVRIAT